RHHPEMSGSIPTTTSRSPMSPRKVRAAENNPSVAASSVMPTDTQSHAPIRLRRAYKKIWPYLRHVLTLDFILLVLALLVHHAKEVEWREVVDTLKDYSWLTTLAGIGCALVTYLIYSS